MRYYVTVDGEFWGYVQHEVEAVDERDAAEQVMNLITTGELEFGGIELAHVEVPEVEVIGGSDGGN